MEIYLLFVVQEEAARRYATVHALHRQDAKRLNEPIEGKQFVVGLVHGWYMDGICHGICHG